MKRTIYGALAAVLMSSGLIALSLVFQPKFIVFCNEWWAICWPFG